MTPATWGVLLGASTGLGLVLVISRVGAIRRPSLEDRVLPYLHDLTTAPGPSSARPAPTNAVAAVFGPLVHDAADAVERVLGGSASIQRRLRRAGLDRTVHEFRIEQVTWGLVGFAVVAAFAAVRSLSGHGSVLSLALACGVAALSGVLARDTHLSGQVKRREQKILAEFPIIAELLTLSVGAGEGPVAALDRVVRRSHGELARDLARVLSKIRTGEPVAAAFDHYAASSGLPVVARFAQAVAVAVERGTPLADVLYAQAGDVREAGRRELIETAARREVFMMVPVVFMVLPVTVLIAFWPGWVGLSLSVG